MRNEKNLHGVTLFSLPIFGPLNENDVQLDDIKKTTSIIGYVDDLNPVITKIEEFDLCNFFSTPI